jgi:uncharacterized protein (DUF486 family)
MHPYVFTPLMLIASNLFMTFAWYGHPKHWAGLCLLGAVYFIFRGA